MEPLELKPTIENLKTEYNRFRREQFEPLLKRVDAAHNLILELEVSLKSRDEEINELKAKHDELVDRLAAKFKTMKSI